MESVKTAIDKGAELCGSRNELGRRLGLSSANITKVYNGERGLTALQIATLGAILNEDAKELLALDAIEREKDPGRAELLRVAFFRRITLGVVACMVTIGAGTGDASARSNAVGVDSLYIVALLRSVLRSLRDALHGACCPIPLRASPSR